MTDTGWIGPVLTAARPKVVAALLRQFRDLDTAEEAFQDACLKALKAWPRNGPPRDAAAWLIMVGKNSAIDGLRRQSRLTPIPADDKISDLSDAEAAAAQHLDEIDYRDDILRLMFVCCHPSLPTTQQVALTLRIISGVPVRRIAQAFLVTEAAMEQRITRAKARVAAAKVEFESPGAVDRAERVGAVAAAIYLVFNEGYTASAEHERGRGALCAEAIRLARLLLGLFPTEPEVMGLTSLLLLQHARAAARFDSEGQAILLEQQDRGLWDRRLIAEGLALVDKAARHAQPGAYQVQAAIAALHAIAPDAQATDWAQIELLYASLERMQPSPVVTLNRAVAVAKERGPEAALALIEPLHEKLAGYFYFHGARGAFLEQTGRIEAAREAFGRAIALANSAAEAAHIRQRLDQLGGEAASRPAAGHGMKVDKPVSE